MHFCQRLKRGQTPRFLARFLPNGAWLLTIPAFPLSAAPARPSSPGLVAAFAFDEGAGAAAADASGHGHTATLFGATWSPDGHTGAGLSFDGNNDWGAVADSPLLDLTTASLTPNVWTFLFVTYDGAALRLYVNGLETGSTYRGPSSGVGAMWATPSPRTK